MPVHASYVMLCGNRVIFARQSYHRFTLDTNGAHGVTLLGFHVSWVRIDPAHHPCNKGKRKDRVHAKK